MNHNVHVGRSRRDRVEQILRAFHAADVNAVRRGRCCAARNHRHLRAAVSRRLGKGKAHFAGGIIGHVAHRVKAFARCPCCHQHTQTREIALRAEQGDNRAHNGFRLTHAARTRIAARQKARFRPCKMHAAGFQGLHVLLRHRRRPHAGIHGRGKQSRRFRRQDGGGEHIIGNAARHLRHDIRRRGRNGKNIRAFRQRDMLHLPRLRARERVRDDGMVAQRFKRQRLHKLRRVFRHDDVRLHAELAQTGDNFAALVNRNAARYAQHHMPSAHVGKFTAHRRPDPRFRRSVRRR